LFWLFGFVILYAILGVLFNDLYINKTLIITPLITAFFAMIIPFSFSKLHTNKLADYKKNIFNVSLIITLSVVFYALIQYSGFHITGRLNTPIGGSAVLHTVLLLTLAVYMANIKVNYKKVLSILLFVITMLLIVLTGSRTGFFLMIMFVLFILVDLKRPVKTIGISIILISIFLIIFQFLPTDRYANFESGAREINTETSINILKESTYTALFGKGSGQIWPWFAYEEGFTNTDLSQLIYTQYGYILPNPHSVFMGAFVELGLIGLVPLIIIIVFIILKAWLQSVRQNNTFLSTIFIGILCTIPAFALDYYLFKNFPVSAIWWYFVFSAVSITYSKVKTPK